MLVGRPEMATETVPENPFMDVIETCTFVEPPAVTVSDCELVWMLKSGVGGGSGVVLLLLPEPQPQESSMKEKTNRNDSSKRAVGKQVHVQTER